MEDNTNNHMNNSEKKGGMGMMPVVVVGLIVIAIIVFFGFKNMTGGNSEEMMEAKQMAQPTNSSAMSSPMPSVSEAMMHAAMYKNGSYSVKGDYTSPGGPENIDVKLTLEDDVVVDAEVISLAERPGSVKFQGIFIANFKPMVIGKNIADLQLDKVSGSSLTPKGFNNALEKIKAEAKS